MTRFGALITGIVLFAIGAGVAFNAAEAPAAMIIGVGFAILGLWLVLAEVAAIARDRAASVAADRAALAKMQADLKSDGIDDGLAEKLDLSDK